MPLHETTDPASSDVMIDVEGVSKSFGATKALAITRVANTVRALTQGGPVATNLLWSLLWSAAILAVFAPLSVRRYRKG